MILPVQLNGRTAGFIEADTSLTRPSSFIESGATPGPISEAEARFYAFELFARVLPGLQEVSPFAAACHEYRKEWH